MRQARARSGILHLPRHKWRFELALRVSAGPYMQISAGGRARRHCSDDTYVLAVRRLAMTHGSRAPAILAVDDNPDALEILQLLLRGEGFEVITAASGSEALQFMQQHFLPDLVITDYAMPGMTGLDLCNHLRSQPDTRHIPIFLHSALSEPPAASPYDEVFMKPADLRCLVRTVRARLTRRC